MRLIKLQHGVGERRRVIDAHLGHARRHGEEAGGGGRQWVRVRHRDWRVIEAVAEEGEAHLDLLRRGDGQEAVHIAKQPGCVVGEHERVQEDADGRDAESPLREPELANDERLVIGILRKPTARENFLEF